MRQAGKRIITKAEKAATYGMIEKVGCKGEKTMSWTENPCVGGSIPSLAITHFNNIHTWSIRSAFSLSARFRVQLCQITQFRPYGPNRELLTVPAFRLIFSRRNVALRR